MRAVILLVGTLLVGCERRDPVPPPTGGAEAPAAAEAQLRFVGGERCGDCHPQERDRWRGSHHDLAMQEASDSSVLGDFEGARLEHFGVTTEFRRSYGAFQVHTDGPEGEPGVFEVVYTFGVDPLQQYLVRLPGGRLQALPFAWDSRPADRGGQRWFHLHPDEPIPAGDELHWTGLNQNWNHMCAECHSTGVRKDYRVEEDRYDTTWSDIDVSCEACHGRGSRHVSWAEAGGRGGDDGLEVKLANDAEWILDPGAAIARRSAPRTSESELETCALCHSRRGALADGYVHGQPLLDSHRLALLEPRLYQPDGQILEEVYVHGSFLQSRMYAAGVGCTDCHDPHSLTLAEDPDASCARCHRPEVFDSPEHHHHRQGSAGASCVACHMPERVYMGVDPRRDHSLRVPRPDLSVTLGSSNACTDCHEDQPAAWAAAAFEGWYPERSGSPHYGQTLARGRARRAGAGEELAALAGDARQPAIVRASALQELAAFPAEARGGAVRQALSDPDPLLRFGALRALAGLEPAGILGRALPLLEDPVRSVRMEAVRVLLGVPPRLWNPADRTALARGVAEFRAGAEANADRPEAWLDLGILHRALGEPEPARGAYERALLLAPGFVPATVNLVDLLRELELDDEGEMRLRNGLVAAPDQADLHHALGLLLIRKQQHREAVGSLARAAELAPDSARYAYVYGVALHSTGDAEGGVAVLETAHQRFPVEPEILFALVTMHRDRGDLGRARLLADRLAAIAPRDPSVGALRSQLEEDRPR